MATKAFSRSCCVHGLDPDDFFAISVLYKSIIIISEGHVHRIMVVGMAERDDVFS